MDLDRIRDFIIGLALVSLIAGAGAIALFDFQSDIKGSHLTSVTNETVTLSSGTGTVSLAAYIVSLSEIRNSSMTVTTTDCNVSSGTLTCNATACIGASGTCYVDYSHYTLTHHLNITDSGLMGVDNATSYFGTAGTIIGVTFLLAIVLGVFYFITRRRET